VDNYLIFLAIIYLDMCPVLENSSLEKGRLGREVAKPFLRHHLSQFFTGVEALRVRRLGRFGGNTHQETRNQALATATFFTPAPFARG
jgi:hypothetical protein